LIDSISATNIVLMLISAPWLDWDQWSPCTKTCGTGTRFRSRRCSSTNPFDCCGVSHEVRNCNTEICPVPGMGCDRKQRAKPKYAVVSSATDLTKSV